MKWTPVRPVAGDAMRSLRSRVFFCKFPVHLEVGAPTVSKARRLRLLGFQVRKEHQSSELAQQEELN